MKSLTVGEFRAYAALTGLNTVDRALILTVGIVEDSRLLTCGELLQIVTRCFYENTSTVDTLMAAGASDFIRQHGESLAEMSPLEEIPENSEIPSLVIALVEDSWWTWTGAKAFYHVNSGEKINHLGRAPLTTYSLDLTVLWYRVLESLFRLRNEANANHTDQESTSTSIQAT